MSTILFYWKQRNWSFYIPFQNFLPNSTVDNRRLQTHFGGFKGVKHSWYSIKTGESSDSVGVRHSSKSVICYEANTSQSVWMSILSTILAGFPYHFPSELCNLWIVKKNMEMIITSVGPYPTCFKTEYLSAALLRALQTVYIRVERCR